MYRTNHFDPGNFSIFYFGGTKSQTGEVYTGADPHFRAFLIHLLHHHIQQSVILVRAGKIQPEKPVQLLYFLGSAEDGLVCLVKRGEQELPCGEQNRDCDDARQAVQGR